VARAQCHTLRGQALLAAASVALPGRAALLRAVERDARTLDRIGNKVADAFALLLRAGTAACGGRREQARALFAEGGNGLSALAMSLWAAAARRRRGELAGGEEGQRFVDEADAAMRAQGICNPARMTAMFFPGRWTET